MRRNIFIRFFIVIALLLTLSLSVLFLLLLSQIQPNAVHEKQRQLENVCSSLVTAYLNMPLEQQRTHDITELTQMVYSLSATANARVFITDADGQTLVCSDANPCIHTTSSVQPGIMGVLENGIDYHEEGTLGNLYVEPYYTCSAPIVIDGVFHGGVFASISRNTAALDGIIGDVAGTYFLTTLVVLAISCVVLYFLTRKLVQPLQAMNHAVREFSKGNFDIRVAVRGRDEVAELAIAFNRMADSLGQLESMRSSFVANVSHELKTPMTNIGGFIDGILDGTIPQEKHSYYLGIISSEIKRLSRLVKSLLYLSKIEAGEELPRASQFDVYDVIRDVIIVLEPELSAKKLELEGLDWDTKMEAEADRDMIFQVIYNLLENAIKYSEPGSTILFSFKTHGKQHSISIRNTGAGIPAEDLPHIFDRFYKVDKSRGLNSKSTGLGLYLVKTLLAVHGQTITADSDGSHYCEFTFTLPRA